MKRPSPSSLPQLKAEWTGDIGVSVFDFAIISYWFGRSVPVAPAYADLNLDEGISVFDFSGYADNFGIGVVFETAFASRAVASKVDLDRELVTEEVDARLAVHDLALNEVLLEWTTPKTLA